MTQRAHSCLMTANLSPPMELFVMANERTKPYVNTVGDRLSEGFAMHGDEYECHGGIYEDLDVYYPNRDEIEVVDIREGLTDDECEWHAHYQELRGMDDEDIDFNLGRDE